MKDKLRRIFCFVALLPKHATGEQLFATMDSYDMTLTLNGRTVWEFALTEHRQLLESTVNWWQKYRLSLQHCMIHRQALATKKMKPDMKQMMDEAILTVNAIKMSATSTRLFKVLCQEMGAEHQQLLFHSAIRWLSRGKVFSRLYELREEVSIFLLKNSLLLPEFSDEKWLALLAYLADMFSWLNDLNTGLQGKNTSVFLIKLNMDQKTVIMANLIGQW